MGKGKKYKVGKREGKEKIAIYRPGISENFIKFSEILTIFLQRHNTPLLHTQETIYSELKSEVSLKVMF